MSIFVKYLTVFGMAMLPVLELRGAVPYGVALGLSLPSVLAVSILGNMLPVPFIIVFIRRIFEWMKKKSERLGRIALKFEKKAANKHELIRRYELFGLVLLVAIPLPGTGAWTGALVAALCNLRLKVAVPSIGLGVVIAGVIMSIVTYGVDMLI